MWASMNYVTPLSFALTANVNTQSVADGPGAGDDAESPGGDAGGGDDGGDAVP